MSPSTTISRDRHRPAPPLLLAEAGAAILAATLAIRLRRFRVIAKGLESPEIERHGANIETACWIRRAVLAWGRRLLGRAKGFERGLAAASMLRSRRLS